MASPGTEKSKSLLDVASVDASFRERQEHFDGNVDHEVSEQKQKRPLEWLGMTSIVNSIARQAVEQNPGLEMETAQQIVLSAVLATVASVRHHLVSQEIEQSQL